jgi:hypothetical protein
VTGESAREVAAALAGLPAGWTILHDVRWPGRNDAIEAVVVGPGGVFAVHARDWPGVVAVQDGALVADGRPRDAAVGSCADAAEAVGGIGFPVSPVLCLVRDGHLALVTRGVMVCTHRNLVSILRTCPVVLSAKHVSSVLSALETHLRTAVAPVEVAASDAPEPTVPDPVANIPTDLPAPRPKPRKPFRAERRARRPPLARFVVAAAVVVGAVVAGPDIAASLGPTVSSEISRLIADDGACPVAPTAAGAGSTAAPRKAGSQVRRTGHSTKAGSRAGSRQGDARTRRAAARNARAATALTPC